MSLEIRNIPYYPLKYNAAKRFGYFARCMVEINMMYKHV